MRISYLLLALTLLFSSSCVHTTKVQTVMSAEPHLQSAVPASAVRNPSAEDLDWFAAADKQVENAICRIKLPVTTAEIKNYYKKLYNGVTQEDGKYEVFGVPFEYERPELVLAFSKLLIPEKYLGPPKDQQAPQNLNDKYRFDPKCKNVLCASETIFGKDVGPQMIFLMEKFDINASPYTHGNSTIFNPDEIADIIRSLELIDPSLSPFQQNQKLTKFTRGYTLQAYGSGSSVLANASIEFFDGWSTYPSSRRQYTAFHEYAHNFAKTHLESYDSAQAWLSLSGWSETNDPAKKYALLKEESEKPHPFVSLYGQSNPVEDFAESVSAYRLNPDSLKKRSEAKYEFIKYYVFDGLEYNSAKGCQSEPSIKKYQTQIDANTFPFTVDEKSQVLKSCRLEFYALAFANGYQSTFNACVNYEATDLWLKKAFDKNSTLAPQSIYSRSLGLSNLKFKHLALEITNVLNEEATSWLLSKLQANVFSFRSDMDTESYCDLWGRAQNYRFPVENEKTKWNRNNSAPVQASILTSAKRGKLIAMCKQISLNVAPTSKSSSSMIQKFIKTVSIVTTQDILKDRNIKRDDILEAISKKTLPRK